MSEKNIEPNFQNKPDIKIKGRSILLAFFLNFLSPGLGLFYSGKFVLGIIIALFWPVIVGLFFSFIISFPSLITLFIVCFILNIIYVTLLISTIYYAHKNENIYTVRRWNNPVFYIIFFIFFSIYAKPIANVFVEAYRIPTGSMENTVLAGDFIIVGKTNYGIIIPFTNKKIINLKSPERNDVAVFMQELKEDKSPWIMRIIGLPGDSIVIVNKAVYINGKLELQNKEYRYDKVEREKGFINPRIYPNGAPWNEDNYGPYYIPKKGDVINLESENKEMWRKLIIKDAEKSDEEFPSKLLNEKKYVIKNNYYFMMGDNRNNSLDSRFIGPVAEDDIIGKASIIYFNKVDLSRIGTRIK